jgi:hypothetical protein
MDDHVGELPRIGEESILSYLKTLCTHSSGRAKYNLRIVDVLAEIRT